jgi:hypothetical protein
MLEDHASIPFICIFHVHACPCCLSMHLHASCPCCMSLLHVQAAFQFCVSILHVNSACQPCMPMLKVHAVNPCYMSKLHVHTTGPCFMSMPLIHAAGPNDSGDIPPPPGGCIFQYIDLILQVMSMVHVWCIYLIQCKKKKNKKRNEANRD